MPAIFMLAAAIATARHTGGASVGWQSLCMGMRWHWLRLPCPLQRCQDTLGRFSWCDFQSDATVAAAGGWTASCEHLPPHLTHRITALTSQCEVLETATTSHAHIHAPASCPHRMPKIAWPWPTGRQRCEYGIGLDWALFYVPAGREHSIGTGSIQNFRYEGWWGGDMCI